MKPQILESPDVIINPYRFASSAIPSPVHYYTMGDGVTDETDTGVGTALTLTETGTVTQRTGKNGNGRENSGSASNYLSNATLTSTYTGSKVWSISCWVLFDSLSSTLSRICGTNGSSSVQLNVNGTDLRWATNSVNLDHTAVTLATGSFYHICFGYNGTDRWITVNNTTPSTSTVGALTTHYGTWLKSNTTALDGVVDEVAYFDEDIRGAALTELYNAGTGKFWNGSAWV